MATYLELESLRNNSELRARIRVATGVAADTIRGEVGTTPNHTARLAWAKLVFEKPAEMGDQLFWAVLVANKSATLANITGAPDTAIQTNVDAAVDLFAV